MTSRSAVECSATELYPQTDKTAIFWFILPCDIRALLRFIYCIHHRRRQREMENINNESIRSNQVTWTPPHKGARGRRRFTTGIAASKGNQILGLIRRNITYKGKKLIIPLYKAIVRPHLEYCIQAWRPYRKKDIDTLERIQRRATKMIPELRDLSYEERLKECGLTTLETRRLRGDQIEVFKILNGYENIDRNMFFSLKKDSRTRGHEVKLVKDQCRLDIRKHSFSQRTINEWNKLSTDCVTASSVNMFKNKVDTYLRRAGYK